MVEGLQNAKPLRSVGRRLGALKPQGHKVEFINEGIDRTHRTVFDDSRSVAPQ
jgi:hypothetical protein